MNSEGNIWMIGRKVSTGGLLPSLFSLPFDVGARYVEAGVDALRRNKTRPRASPR